MDMGLITSAAGGVATAIEIGKTLVGIRDATKAAPEITKLNDSLFQAQQALFRLMGELMSLQQKHLETAQQLREAQEAIAERGRYTLVDTGKRQFAYRANVTPELGGTGQPAGSEPVHYVCQPCFDNGRKVVLKLTGPSQELCLFCSVCKNSVSAVRAVR